MSDEPEDFTAEDAAAATTALRAALGLAPERFGVERFVSMMSDEIEQLRETGLDDAAISKVLEERAGLRVTPQDIGRYYTRPDNRGRP